MPSSDLPYVEVAGDGPAVVLLHAGVADSRQWEPQWPALAERHRVLRYDRRGYGRSSLPAFAYTDFDDLVAVLDAAGMSDVAVVASSGGGVRALQLAANRPDLVRGLVLLCTDADLLEPTASLRAFGDREDALIEAGDLVGATELNVATWVGPEGDEETRALVRAMQQRAFEVQVAAEDVDRGPGPDTHLARITVPVTLVTGAHDVDYFTATADALAERLPDARRIALDWAGHLPNLERPAEITHLLLATL